MRLRVVAKVLLSAHDGTVLLLRRSETDSRRPLQWDIPGGHVDNGEHPDQAALRETYEETGVTIEPDNLRLAYALTEQVDDDLVVTWLFFVADTTQTQIKLNPDEHNEYQWQTLDYAIGELDYERQKRALEFIRDNGLIRAVYD